MVEILFQVKKKVAAANVLSMMTSSNGNIFCVTGPLYGEFTGHRWNPPHPPTPPPTPPPHPPPHPPHPPPPHPPTPPPTPPTPPPPPHPPPPTPTPTPTPPPHPTPTPHTPHPCTQRLVTRSSDVFVDIRLNKRLNKLSRRQWLETPSWPLWRHCNAIQDWSQNRAQNNNSRSIFLPYFRFTNIVLFLPNTIVLSISIDVV